MTQLDIDLPDRMSELIRVALKDLAEFPAQSGVVAAKKLGRAPGSSPEAAFKTLLTSCQRSLSIVCSLPGSFGNPTRFLSAGHVKTSGSIPAAATSAPSSTRGSRC